MTVAVARLANKNGKTPETERVRASLNLTYFTRTSIMSAQDSERWREQLKGLTFDVFGTCVDWRSTVEEALTKEAATKIGSEAFGTLPPAIQVRVKSLTGQDWADFAQQWKTSYLRFTRSFVPGVTAWKDIDTHYYDSLVKLLDEWQLSGLYGPDEITQLSRIWHFLDPWPEASKGIHMLGTKFATASLSNGNQALQRDLKDHGDLGFHILISAEDFRAYKPDKAVYLGACKKLGLEPQQVALVAAHLNDLKAARAYGLRTIYVERPGEEEWAPGEEEYEQAKQWVDIWVAEGEGGFVEVARQLGIA